MKIYIIRHGDPDYSIDSLTEKGWREAKLLSDRMAKLPIDDFYCSPLGRAQDTSKPTLEKTGKTAETLFWLREFAGQITSPFTEKKRVSWDLPPSMWCKEERYYDVNNWAQPELMAQGSAAQIYKETTDGIDALLEKYGWKRDGRMYIAGEDKNIALFCHFAMGITVMAHILGISPVVAQNSFFLAPTSVTTLVSETDASGGSHFRATMVGDISHLYHENEPMSESGLYPHFEK